MNFSPASSRSFQVGLRHHPRISDHGDLRQPMRGSERLDDRHDGLGLSGVAVEGVDLQREPADIGEQADGDLRFQPTLLGESGLTEPVALVGLEVQRRHVVEHEVAGPRPT